MSGRRLRRIAKSTLCDRQWAVVQSVHVGPDATSAFDHVESVESTAVCRAGGSSCLVCTRCWRSGTRGLQQLDECGGVVGEYAVVESVADCRVSGSL